MSDPYAAIVQQGNGVLTLGDPFNNFVAVTPSDTATFAATRALYMGGGSDTASIVVDGAYGGVSVTFSKVRGGYIYPFRVTRVYSTGTTVPNIVALY